MDPKVEAAIVCMIVSNPAGGERPEGWEKRVNDFIRAQRDFIEDLTQPNVAFCDFTVMMLELRTLKFMADHELFGISSNGDGMTCFPLRQFHFLPRELARGLLRTMRTRKLVYFSNGLWSEDGEPRGSGYGITMAGRGRVRDYEEGRLVSTDFNPKLPFGGNGTVPF